MKMSKISNQPAFHTFVTDVALVEVVDEEVAVAEVV